MENFCGSKLHKMESFLGPKLHTLSLRAVDVSPFTPSPQTPDRPPCRAEEMIVILFPFHCFFDLRTDGIKPVYLL